MSHLSLRLVLPILLLVSQVYMQRMTTASTPAADGQAGMMKQMSTMMTLMFGFFTLQVPAGLTLYWVTSNLLQMGQTYALSGMQNDTTPAVSANGTAAAGAATDISESKPESAGDSQPKKSRPKSRRRRRK